MTKQEFIAEVWSRLPPVNDKGDIECTQRCIEELFEEGYTLEDAVRYTRHIEHVSPDIPEERALKVLHEISRKYKTNKPRAIEVEVPTVTLYKIVRYYHPSLNKEDEVIEEGKTLEEAREHCNSPDSHVAGEYFDGYEIE